MDFNFLHLSDLHFLKEANCNKSMFGDILYQSYPLNSLLNDASKLNPYEFVVITGDLCHSGSIKDYQALKELLNETFKVPVFVTLGNHDQKEAMFEVFKFEAEQTYSDLFWLYRIGELVVIALNSASASHSDGQITINAIENLDRALELYYDHPMILMTHHHLIVEQFVMPSCQFPSAFNELIKKYNIKCILNGHTHHFYRSTFANVPYITAASMSFVAEDENNELMFFSSPCVNLIHLNETGVTVDVQTLAKTKYIKTVHKNKL